MTLMKSEYNPYANHTSIGKCALQSPFSMNRKTLSVYQKVGKIEESKNYRRRIRAFGARVMIFDAGL